MAIDERLLEKILDGLDARGGAASEQTLNELKDVMSGKTGVGLEKSLKMLYQREAA